MFETEALTLDAVRDSDALAVKKHVGPALRRWKLDGDIRNLKVNELQWSDLNKCKRDLVDAARTTLAKIEDGTEEQRAAELETVYDALMAAVDALEEEKDHRSSSGDRSPRPFAGDPRRPMGDDRAVGGGNIPEVESRVLAPEQRFADYLARGRRQDYRGLQVGDYLRSMVLGPGNDAERRALAEGTDSTGGYTVPTELAGQMIDLLRARTVAIRAGARTIPLSSDNLSIAKIASDPTPAWRAENAEVSESDPTFSRVLFEPKSLAVIVKVSRELLDDSVNVREELPRVLAAAMAQELDRVVFLGSGSSNEPSGLDNIANVQSVAHDATVSDYTPLTKARKALMNSNVPTVSGYVMHPDAEAEFGDLVDSNGQPLNYPSILDRPDPMRILTTTQLPTDLGTGSNEAVIYAGDYSMLAIGMRQDVRVEVLRERYADYHQYGFVCHMRADVAAIHPEAFCRVTGVQLS